MINHGKNIKIFTGNSHPELAKEIADILGLPLGLQATALLHGFTLTKKSILEDCHAWSQWAPSITLKTCMKTNLKVLSPGPTHSSTTIHTEVTKSVSYVPTSAQRFSAFLTANVRTTKPR